MKAKIVGSPWRRIEIEARWNAASFHSADPLECFPVESGAKRATLSCPNESATREQNSSSSSSSGTGEKMGRNEMLDVGLLRQRGTWEEKMMIPRNEKNTRRKRKEKHQSE